MTGNTLNEDHFPIKITASYFVDYRQTDSKISMEREKTQNSQNNIEKNKVKTYLTPRLTVKLQ